MRDEIIRRFNDNLRRASNLVAVYRQVARPTQGRQPVPTVDVLRAAVVFLHAALEEVFRNIAIWKYPLASEKVLNDIPLVGATQHGRAERFLLGKLIDHRNKLVSEVIRESVGTYAGYFTVNNTTDICSFLNTVSVDPNTVNAEFPALTELIKRRHHIVHQADRQRIAGRGNHRAQGLNETTVNEWIASVERFVPTVMQQIAD